jgi:hypothetical protein
MEDVGILCGHFGLFYDHLAYFIWYILWSFGIFFSWYFLPRKINLATLCSPHQETFIHTFSHLTTYAHNHSIEKLRGKNTIYKVFFEKKIQSKIKCGKIFVTQ